MKNTNGPDADQAKDATAGATDQFAEAPLRFEPQSDGDQADLDMNEPDYVVGIGASAGGLEALEELFENMPIESGMAFIIVQHLSPDHKSLMDQLLARKTFIPIKLVEDGMRIERDQIYLMPPNQEMIASNKRFFLTERDKSGGLNLPINTFLRSMSETYQEKSIAIILSGTGSDGSGGLPSVHDNGGFVVAQAPQTCKFDNMPASAIATGKVDLVLSPGAMPDALLKYSKRTAKAQKQLNLAILDAEENKFSEILILLNNRFDLDFSQYKPSTITRRLERRLAVSKVSSLNEYLSLLLSNADELEALYFDLLIGVTEFFRDVQAFASLRSSIAKMLNELPAEEEMRIWTLGCATGQEAYSLSIMISEEIAKSDHPERKYKLFATDIHRRSLAIASAGIYSEEALKGLTQEQKDKYFTLTKDGESFQVISEIRSPILFAPQNILKDPPFTKLHLVTCRNVLIYFNAQAQQRVLSLLTFSLINRGVLFLGPSETLSRHDGDFEQIDQMNRIMRKLRDSAKRPQMGLVPRQIARPLTVNTDAPLQAANTTVKSKRAVEVLLQKFVPASVLLDSEGTVLHVFGDVGKFLSMDAGAASLNIRSMVGEEARNNLTHMLIHVNKSNNPSKLRSVRGFPHHERVDVTLQPLSSAPTDMGYVLASFAESSAFKEPEEISEVALPTGDMGRINELEEELTFARESLQTTVEELQSSNEELQASNEELMASNEELQSTNEELHSVNEELYSVNAEYKEKERERSELEADERSIFDTHGLGVMFLDEALHVRKCSTVAAKVFGILESDTGRAITAISSQSLKELRMPIRDVSQGKVDYAEGELRTEDGSVFDARISAHNRPAVQVNGTGGSTSQAPQGRGVILTLAEVTDLSGQYEKTLERESRLKNVVDAVSDGYFEWNTAQKTAFISPSLLSAMGYGDANPSWQTLLGDQFADFEAGITDLGQTGDALNQVFALRMADGSVTWRICRGRVFQRGPEQEAIFAGVIIDFDRHKKMELKLNAQANDLERSNELLEQFAYIVSHDLKAPLRHIQFNLEFLKEDMKTGDEEKIDKSMADIQGYVDRLRSLIDDIITYSRVTSERKTVETVDLEDVLDTALTPLTQMIDEKNITLTREALPPIQGDRTLLTQLFQNLLGNACKYNDKPDPTVTVTHRMNGTNCEISVQDNGIGFDEAYTENLFAPFRRLVTQSEFEGTGIGLSICKTVVDQHQGRITATSKKGVGSTFTVTLPVKQKV